MLVMKKLKKILTLDDLYIFYLHQNKNCMFNAKASGYQLSVQVPGQFKLEKKENDGTLLFCKVKLMHSGQNRNHSSVTEDALKKASEQLAYKPILANFMEYTDESTGETLKDFTSHDIELKDDGSVVYIEKQIGCFTSDDPFFEVEEDTGHNFLYGYCAIPKEYTDACSIIERKGGTKISVELAVNEMKYDSKSKILELTDVTIMGATCLGKNPDTLIDVGEGMLNARLDIADFSIENNSLCKNYDSTLLEMQDRLSKLENACFNNIINNLGKEEIEVENKENFDEVAETEEVEVTETKETTEEEVTVTKNESEETVDEASEEVESVEENPSEKDKEEKKDYSITVAYADRKFAVSLQEKIFAIQDLVNATYSEQDNTYYGVTVYEDHVVMQDYWNGRYFKQSYTAEDDTYSLVGDRVEVFVEFVTADEQKELDTMRANYEELKEFKEAVEKNELHKEKENLLSNEKYSILANNKDFINLKNNMDNYTLEELEKEAKVIKADYADTLGVFGLNKDISSINNIKAFRLTSNKEPKKQPYGNIFKEN